MCFYKRIPSRQTIDGCFCYGIMITELSKLISIKWSFSDESRFNLWYNDDCFMLDAIPVIATFQKASQNDVVAEHPELWSGV